MGTRRHELILISIIVAAALLIFWHRQTAELFTWGARQILVLAGFQVLGTLAGVLAGRPLARVFVRMFVPPDWRSPLAFLWAADGKRL